MPNFAPTMVSVQLDGLTKRFGDVTAVDEISLSVNQGELFFLLGPSGCGKTTLLRLIGGFYQPDAGNIKFDGRSVEGLPAFRRNAAMVFQNYALFPHMTVYENVAYGLHARKLSRIDVEDRVPPALDLVQRGPLSFSQMYSCSTSHCQTSMPSYV